jgi:hypothetical protein
MTTYTWRQGSTLPIFLSITDGDFTGSEDVRCALKRKSGSDPAGEELLEFEVAYLPEDGDTPAMWFATGSPEQSLTIRPGLYFTDMRIENGDTVTISDKVTVRLVKTVTTEGA